MGWGGAARDGGRAVGSGAVSGLEWLAVAAVGAGAVAQAVTGLGFALVCAPVLIALLGPNDGVAVVCVLATLASVLPLAREHAAARWGDVLMLFVPTALATPVVAWALAGLPTQALAAVGGLGVVAAVLLVARGRASAQLAGRGGAVAAGVTSAGLNYVGGVGGPPVALYATNAGWTVPETRATLQSFFVAQNVVTVLVLGWATPSWQLVAAVLVGQVAGTLLATRVSHERARVAVLVVAAVGGFALVAGALH